MKHLKRIITSEPKVLVFSNIFNIKYIEILGNGTIDITDMKDLDFIESNDILEVVGNLPGGVHLCSEANEIVSELDSFITEALGSIVPMNFRFTLVPQPYYFVNVQNDNRELEDRVLLGVPAEVVERLFEVMANDGAAWLSGNYEIRGNGTRRLFFNYQDRFNRYSDHWMWREGDTEVSPKRGALLRFFEKHPRDNEPKWLSGLKWEEANLESYLKVVTPEELLPEALIEPSIDDEGVIYEVWDTISDLYEEELKSERRLLKYFADPEMETKRQWAIRRFIEAPVLEKLLRVYLEYWNEKDLLTLGGSGIVKEIGLTEFDDVDPGDLDESLEVIFRELIRKQTKERFANIE